jgi:hypothetical protein
MRSNGTGAQTRSWFLKKAVATVLLVLALILLASPGIAEAVPTP